MVLAHVEGFAGGEVLGAWSWDPGVLTGLGLLAALYAFGLKRSAGRRRRVLPWWRSLFFYSGLLVLFLALQSPLDTLAHDLFSMHMVQHLLLMMVAPPLLLLGAPIIPLLRGLPRPVRRRVLAPLARSGAPLRRLSGFVALPVVSWSLYIGAFWVWHIPALYTLALQYTAVHILQHACFFGTGALFWWNVVDPIPLRAHLRHPIRILYLFLATVPGSALGALLTLSPTLWYASYERAPLIWGLTPLEDQSLGGLIMWVPGGLLYLLAISVVFFSMPETSEERWRERRA